ncbi:MAG: ATP-dependent metallopeptidase FtsH/Yme1/Tma family protein, partial [Dehalococcoidia bacterium]
MAVRPPEPTSEAPPGRRIPWWLIAIVVTAVLFAGYLWLGRDGGTEKTPLSQVAEEVQAGQVQRIVVSGDSLKITLTDGTEQTSNREPDASLTESLASLGVT